MCYGRRIVRLMRAEPSKITKPFICILKQRGNMHWSWPAFETGFLAACCSFERNLKTSVVCEALMEYL